MCRALGLGCAEPRSLTLVCAEPIFVAMCLFFGMKLDIQLATDKEKEAAAHVAASEDEKQQLLEAAIHYPDQ